MELYRAKEMADDLVKDLTPFALRIEIAGSIRRERPEVGDIEIVMIRKNSELINLMNYIDSFEKIKGVVSGKYIQRKLPVGIKLDLFFCEEDQWGNIFLIRTGSYDFNIWFMTELRRKGYKHMEGRLYKDEKVIPCYEEEELFKYAGIDFVDPIDRNPEYLRINGLT